MTMTELDRPEDMYGRHAVGSRSVFPQDELTVEKIVGEYWHALSPLDSGRHGWNCVEEGEYVRPTVAEIVRRLALEELGQFRIVDDLSVPPQEDTELLTALGPRRPAATTAVWWDEDTPSKGVFLSPYRPGPKPLDEPTVGFMPLSEFTRPDAPTVPSDAPLVSYNEYGQPGFHYDEPPIGHETGATKIADFPPVPPEPPKIPFWKQAMYGYLPKKWWR